ncbi:MAG: pantoate--beta-alanine ligase [Candidatus Electrothrix aestuarii]|uniref:Pantothenate synthetase n=1 Tax=Candidatus Electrothrix aestuarii TaxID=3062594 RepID=A0AAU8LSJ8_9BACT|nr:pantoate--beta-alanine ligase [Candidatus Electrothrix aestuarii]
MKIIRTPKEMTAWSKEQAVAGQRIGFVPTMGYFHEGHLSLMRRAGELADLVVVSLFVNPTQFGPKEDLSAYPRDFERDRSLAESVGVDVIFVPEPDDMYPAGYNTTVTVGDDLASQLCGATRPGHFAGVATIVSKLFNIVRPDLAVFGEKDFQQLAVIRRMSEDLNLGVEIIGHPIIREQDGLAMSSRNTYLQAEEREAALSLSRALALAREMVAEGQQDEGKLVAALEEFIYSFAGTAVDYISFVDQFTLQPVAEVNKDTVLALAVKINAKVRLIDNGFVLEVAEGKEN